MVVLFVSSCAKSTRGDAAVAGASQIVKTQQKRIEPTVTAVILEFRNNFHYQFFSFFFTYFQVLKNVKLIKKRRLSQITRC
jgi:hypothetical protein